MTHTPTYTKTPQHDLKLQTKLVVSSRVQSLMTNCGESLTGENTQKLKCMSICQRHFVFLPIFDFPICCFLVFFWPNLYWTLCLGIGEEVFILNRLKCRYQVRNTLGELYFALCKFSATIISFLNIFKGCLTIF